jgi:uncharacterized protein
MFELMIQKVGIDPKDGEAVIVLKERDGQRLLPIWVGPFEFRAILAAYGEKAKETSSRPQTHDLFVNTIEAIGQKIDRLLITEISNSTFFAKLCLKARGTSVDIDCRPSDGIALALRQGAPIMVNDKVLDDAGFTEPEDETALFKKFVQQIKASDFSQLEREKSPPFDPAALTDDAPVSNEGADESDKQQEGGSEGDSSSFAP